MTAADGPPSVSGQTNGKRAGGASARARFGRPTGRDVVSGLVTGLFSIPEGMAYASIGGFSPVAGLYSGIVPTVVGSLFARTVLMVTTLTSAIALSSRSVLQQAGLDPADPGNIAMLVVLVGAVMLLFGVLRLGSIMGFVSNAVVTGFTTGIAVQIVAGVLGDATGYDPRIVEHDRQVRRLAGPRGQPPTARRSVHLPDSAPPPAESGRKPANERGPSGPGRPGRTPPPRRAATGERAPDSHP